MRLDRLAFVVKYKREYKKTPTDWNQCVPKQVFPNYLYYIMAGAIFKALGDKLGSKSKGTRLPVRLQ